MSSLNLKSFGQVIAWAAAVLSSLALAQGVTGAALTGKITAKDGGAALPDVTVRITNTATGAAFSAVTVRSGTYVL
ncbi:MAG TPA: hypothetical protein VND93_15255, partial [Myxococcales bacterium]|nr:hypothetical protein [Myxococcales bacterium]